MNGYSIVPEARRENDGTELEILGEKEIFFSEGPARSPIPTML